MSVGLCIGRWDGSLVRAFRDKIKLVTRKGDHNVLICLAL